tara:strand:- start:11478 stop:14462 length:2985 start_codon:yes stop_codon:yes gene_type:complete
MNQKIQLYIENEQVDVFQDGSINIVSSIKDFREPDKIFTDFSRNFNLPATSRNNKLFKHYYNYDLVGNNFDARSSKEARIEINDRPYKDGYITLESVKLQFNKPSSYRVTFYGNLKLLRELFNNVKLTNLEWLERFNINDSHFDSSGDSFYHYLSQSKDFTSSDEFTIGTGDGVTKKFRLLYSPYPQLDTDFKLYNAGSEVATSNFSYSYTSGDVIFNTAPNAGNAITTKLFYPQPIIVPLISSSERLYYTNNANFYGVLSDGNLYYNSSNYPLNNQVNGLKFEHLKPGVRVHLILRAIEQKINRDPNVQSKIEFSNDFLNASNKDYYNLYMWLNKDKKANTLFDQGSKEIKVNTFNISSNTIALYQDASSQGLLEISSVNSSGLTGTQSGDTIIVRNSTAENIDYIECRFRVFTSDTSNAYGLRIYRNGAVIRTFEPSTGNGTSKEYDFYVEQDGDYQFELFSPTGLNINNGFEAKFVIAGDRDDEDYNDVIISGGALTFNKGKFSISKNMPDMNVIEFLSGLFKMFNLVCFVENAEDSSYSTTQSNMKRIRIMTYDSYYASSSSELDITSKVDTSESSVERLMPYSQIEFKYEDTESVLAEQHRSDFGIEWGGESWTYSDSRGEQKYEIIPPFSHLKYERLLLTDGTTPSTLQVGFSVKRSNAERNVAVGGGSTAGFKSFQEEKYSPHFSKKPLLFYAHRETSGTQIPYVYTDASNNAIFYGALTTYFVPLNSVDINTSQSNHFGEEVDEYRVYNANEQSNVNNLFNIYYKNYIEHLFDVKSRLIKVNANLTNAFISKYSLADKIRILDKTFSINKIDIDLQNGESKLELQRYYDVVSFDCLALNFNARVEVTSGGNAYVFDNKYGIYQMGLGTYTMNDVPSAHPIAFHNFGKESRITYTGTASGGTKTGLDGNTYTYYYGNITITVAGDFGTMSYECYNHGYMGGENNLVYNADCLTSTTPPTPPVVGNLTVDATDIYVDSGIITSDQTDE